MDENDGASGRAAADARVHQYLEDRLTAAVSRGMRDVLLDPEVISRMGSVALTVLQKQAAQRTGNWLLGIVRKALSKWLVIAFLMLLIAKSLGLPAAMKVWSMFTTPEGGTR
jgi:hypothetical protein